MTVMFARHTILAMAVLATLSFSSGTSNASVDLMDNGSFETGNLDEWIAVDSSARRSTQNEPAHLGQQSARIGKIAGTAVTEGRISQTVSIPADSSATFSAWYRLGIGSRLTISLKLGDSVIKEWDESSPITWTTNYYCESTIYPEGCRERIIQGWDEIAPWESVTYDLDKSLAGKSVTVEFVGVPHRETMYKMVHECVVYEAIVWCAKQVTVLGYPYVDDVTLTYSATVATYETTVSITGLPPHLSTKLLVDGEEETTLAGGQSRTLEFQLGQTHEISVEALVHKDDTTRYHCASETTTVRSNGSVIFSYMPQYYLSVTSPYGDPTGSGWYDEGSEASFSVAPAQGFLIQQVFVLWKGDITTTKPQGSLRMNRPSVVEAEWREDYSQLLLALTATIFALAAAVLLVLRRGALAKAKRGVKPTTGLSTKFCRHCGTKMPRDRRFCEECGAKLS